MTFISCCTFTAIFIFDATSAYYILIGLVFIEYRRYEAAT